MISDAAFPLLPCMQVMHQLFYFLDESKYDDLVSLFTPDGTWLRQGERLAGRAHIMQALCKRPGTQRTRHVISNSFIESHSQDHLRMAAYMVAYRFDDGTVHAGAVGIDRPLRLSVLHAALRQIDGAWKIADMTLTPEFEFVSDPAAGAGR